MSDPMNKAWGDGVWHQAVQVRMEIEAARSWDVALVRDPALLVPVDVRALVVGDGATTEQAAVLPQPGPDDWPAHPTPFGALGTRASGVWLHVAMPDGLTRAATRQAGTDEAVDAGNPMNLPALPDRLLVLRLVHGQAARRGWVLEADRGRRRDLSGWTEPGAPSAPAPGYIPPDRLHAMAGGDPAWAGCVDGVLDRFAMHDDLNDLSPAVRADAVLTYLIVGWWSQSRLDPVRPANTRGDFSARLTALGWSVSEASLDDLFEPPPTLTPPSPPPINPGAPPGGVLGDLGVVNPEALGTTRRWPGRTLIHGVISGVRASGAGLDLRPLAPGIQAAIGGHPFAALSALLADGSPEQRLQRERLLMAFTSGKLLGIEGADGVVAVDEERHGRQFDAVAGGTRSRPDRLADGDPLPPKELGRASGVAPLVTRDDIAIADTDTVIDPSTRLAAAMAPSQGWSARRFRDVHVPLPRFHHAAAPAIALRGAARSQRHGGDGRHEADGTLRCRFGAALTPGWEGVLAGEELPLPLRTVGCGAVPAEVDLLLQECVLTDAGRIQEIAAWAQALRGLPVAEVTARLEGELGFRQFPVPPNRRRSDMLGPEQEDALRSASLWRGEDCSPVGMTRWSQPWVPLYLEYRLEVTHDAAADINRGWLLGDTDLHPTDVQPSAIAVLDGRTLLTAANARALADGIHQWLAEEDARDAAGLGALSEPQEEAIRLAADAASGLDVLTGDLAALRAWALGLDPARPGRLVAPGQTAEPPQVAAPLRPLVAGRMRLLQARLIDAFGRVLDLGATPVVAATHATDTPGEVLLRPRITLPSRLMLRFVDAGETGADPEEARIDQERPERAPSPLCGWLLPDHVDEALEVFDATGTPMGQLFHHPTHGGVLWEGAPGRPGPLGAAPSSAHRASGWMGAIVRGLISKDRAWRAGGGTGESALSALLRGVDTTMWSVDPISSAPAGPIAALVGRPIAVVRATMQLDVQVDLDAVAYATSGGRSAREAALRSLAAQAIRVRLGEMSRADDGLLAWFVDDDFERVGLIHPWARLAARDVGPGRGHLAAWGAPTPLELLPITHPYVREQSDLTLRFGQRLRLTLLMLPHLAVHATTGVLPRKRLALARDWFEEGLRRLSPSIRVGPVLYEGDPEGGVRLPRVSGFGEAQHFTHRHDPQGWRDDAILAASQAAWLPELPFQAREGWIRIGGES